MQKYDVIIIGAGPAGMTAAIYAVRANMKTLMLDQLAPGGQIVNTNEIENYTGVGAINGLSLPSRCLSIRKSLAQNSTIRPLYR